MLYYLFDYLEKLQFPGARLFHYVSFRSAVAIVLALLLATVIGNRIIESLDSDGDIILEKTLPLQR